MFAVPTRDGSVLAQKGEILLAASWQGLFLGPAVRIIARKVTR
jgi:hypothetical protein